MPFHVVLLGDSVFDNAAYTGGGPDVPAQLRGELPADWTTTLLAVDGDVAAGVLRQLRRLPPTPTHLVTPASEPNQRIIRTALAVFNDIITRAAFAAGFSVIDLRLVCNDDGDYANQIEPSVQGGAKIARVVAAYLLPSQPALRAVVVAGASGLPRLL